MKKLMVCAGLLFINFMYSQHGANQLYGSQNSNSYDYRNNDNRAEFNKISNNNESITYKINVLNNVKPDFYLVTLGLNQEALNVKDCNAKINKRLEDFKSVMNKMGIKDEEMYVDFISQTKIYDYESEVKDSEVVKVNQIDKGFEIKKNIIIKLKDTGLFDKLVENAAQYDINNVIKVDYHKVDTEKIYDDMLVETNKILEARKKSNSKLNLMDLGDLPQITVNFYSIQPGNQYKNYVAFESSDVNNINDYKSSKVFVKQEQRKSKTFYFDGQKPDSFDTILNPDTPVVGMQFVMEFTINYRFKK